MNLQKNIGGKNQKNSSSDGTLSHVHFKEFVIAGNKTIRQVMLGKICLPKHKILVLESFS